MVGASFRLIIGMGEKAVGPEEVCLASDVWDFFSKPTYANLSSSSLAHFMLIIASFQAYALLIPLPVLCNSKNTLIILAKASLASTHSEPSPT